MSRMLASREMNLNEGATGETRNRVLLIHGTFAGERGALTKKWWERGSHFASALERQLGDGFAVDDTFVWGSGGENSEKARRQAAIDLLAYLQRLDRDKDCVGIHLVAHSHAGNVVWRTIQLAASKKIAVGKLRSWTTVGTPFLSFSPERLPVTRILLFFFFLLALAFIARNTGAIIAEWEPIFRNAWSPALYVVMGVTALLVTVFLLLAASIVAHLVPGRSNRADSLDNGPPPRWLGIWHPDDEARALLAASLVRPPMLVPRFLRPDAGFFGRMARAATAFDWLFAPAGDQQAWRVMTGKVQGRDIAENLVAVATGPTDGAAWWPALPNQALSEMSEAADVAAAQALQTGRLQLRSIAQQQELGAFAPLFAGTATWQELIHTSYFESPAVRSLIVAHISENVGLLTNPLRNWYTHGPLMPSTIEARNTKSTQLSIVRALLASPAIALLVVLCASGFTAYLRPHTSAGIKERVSAFAINTPDLKLTNSGRSFADIVLTAAADDDLNEALRQSTEFANEFARREASGRIAYRLGGLGKYTDVVAMAERFANSDNQDLEDLRIQLIASATEGALDAGNNIDREVIAGLAPSSEYGYFPGRRVHPIPSLMISAQRLGDVALAQSFLQAYVELTKGMCIDWSLLVRALAKAGQGGLVDDFADACASKALPKALIYRRALGGALEFMTSRDEAEASELAAGRTLVDRIAGQAVLDLDIAGDPDPMDTIASLLSAGKFDEAIRLTLLWYPTLPQSARLYERPNVMLNIVEALRPRDGRLADLVAERWIETMRNRLRAELASEATETGLLDQLVHGLMSAGRPELIAGDIERLDTTIDEIDWVEAPCLLLRSTLKLEALKLMAQTYGGSRPTPEQIATSGARIAGAARVLGIINRDPIKIYTPCVQNGLAALDIALRYHMDQATATIAPLLLASTYGENDAALRFGARALVAQAEGRTRTAVSGIEMAERIPDPSWSLQAIDNIIKDRGLQ